MAFSFISLKLYASLAPSVMFLIIISHFVFEFGSVPSGWIACSPMGSCISFLLGLLVLSQCIFAPESAITSFMCGLRWGLIYILHNLCLLIELTLSFSSSVSIAPPHHMCGFPNVLPPVLLLLVESSLCPSILSLWWQILLV